MPGGDGTGPMGMGSMTGRGVGLCSGSGVPGYQNPVSGRGCGMGYGRGRGFWGRGVGGGRGWRNRYYATGVPGRMAFGAYGGAAPWNRKPDPEKEKQVLSGQAEALQAELDFIRRRLSEIDAAGGDK